MVCLIKEQHNQIELLLKTLLMAYSVQIIAAPGGAKLEWFIIIITWCLLYSVKKRIGVNPLENNKVVNILTVIFCGAYILPVWANEVDEFDNLYIIMLFGGVGLFFLLRFLIAELFGLFEKLDLIEEGQTSKGKWPILFLFLFFIYLMYLLNSYPGSLCVDSLGQLQQALGEATYDNANPVINTWFIALGQKISNALGGDISLGLAVYQIFQFTLFAAVYTYGVCLFKSRGFCSKVVTIVTLVWGGLPYNIIYAVGMWKDSFFAIFLLLSVLLVIDICTSKRIHFWAYISFELVCIVSCLARLTAWPFYVVMSLVMVITVVFKRPSVSKRVLTLSILMILSVGINMYCIKYIKVFQIEKSTWTYSIPQQQISAVLASDCELSEADINYLAKFIDIENTKKYFTASSVDSVASFVNRDYVRKNIGDIGMFYLKWMKKYPAIYLKEYIAMTELYWYPLTTTWTWDTRIFDNPWGIKRQPVILKNHSADIVLTKMNNRLLIKPFSYASVILTTIILMAGYSLIKKRRLLMAFYLPMLAYYGVYMLTSPVALFRYVYPMAICLPLIILLPFWNPNQ